LVLAPGAGENLYLVEKNIGNTIVDAFNNFQLNYPYGAVEIVGITLKKWDSTFIQVAVDIQHVPNDGPYVWGTNLVFVTAPTPAGTLRRAPTTNP
jgi:hypothetical protein